MFVCELLCKYACTCMCLCVCVCVHMCECVCVCVMLQSQFVRSFILMCSFKKEIDRDQLKEGPCSHVNGLVLFSLK